MYYNNQPRPRRLLPSKEKGMPLDPELIRAEPHTEVGQLIQRDVGILLDRWTRRAVQEQPNARRVHHQALLDHMQDLLSALGRSLAESDDAAYLHILPASTHGEQRWETGWSLTEVVRDYQILRLVILDYLEEVLEASPGPRVMMAIGLALDEAIAASVSRYVKSRDEYLRQVEAERADRDQQIQERLQHQAETLREVDRRKSEFVATLGHEMRNPLAPLWHAVRLLELREITDSGVAQIHDIIGRQVQQLARLADDLLDISRIAQDKIELRKEPVDLAAVVTQALQMSAPHLRARHHHFELDLPDEPLWLEADPARLVQIIVNLLNNAAKYTEPGGQVWLAVQPERNDAVIRVRDTGMGIPQEMLPHVFELFTQGEWSVDRSQGGMGIGLALVRRLVDLHGGTIEAHSAGSGLGSEFMIRLPALSLQAPGWHPAPLDGDRHPSSPLARPGRRRILVVDDNVDAAESLKMLLVLEGHEVRLAHDGLAALRVSDDFRPEVVLLDIGLPRMDGYQVARHLRERPASDLVLLVALTGYGQDDDRRRSQEAGFNAHLVKPVDLDALRSALAHYESVVQAKAQT
jgi:signal transduction histidine kinase/ActR/RegA family two-component response regulator